MQLKYLNPGIQLYSVSHEEMRGISICMFGNVGQQGQVKLYRLSLFILTYIIPAGTVTIQAFFISRLFQQLSKKIFQMSKNVIFR